MLRGKQVIIRAIERADLSRFHELEQNVDLVLLNRDEYTPLSLAAREQRFDKDLAETPSWFAIEADGIAIGHIGLYAQDRRNGTAALGIGIWDHAYLGRGYGRDAVETFVRWAFRVQNWRKIWLNVLADNERAVRAYRACGFVDEALLREGTIFDGRPADELLMGLLREEWESAQALQSERAGHGLTG
jgi:diamine N-acetyltransferase